MAVCPKSFIIILATILLTISRAYSFKNGGITLDLIHRDSLDTSSTNHNNDNRISNLRNAFRRSFARKRALSSLASHGSSSSSSSSPAPPPSSPGFNSTITSGQGEYLMKIKIGTPPVEVTAIADTGSDLTWTQCVPCTDCFDQTQPLFDPSQSSTYRLLSCTAALCNDEGFDGSCSTNNTCLYDITYGDGSYTLGDLASETFTFDSDNNGGSLTIPKVVFGCGHEDIGDFGGTASGIIGLGGSNSSIIRQLDSYVNGRFSYCLTSFNSTASSKISFGTNAVVSGPDVVSTPLLRGNLTTFYYISLVGITIEDQQLSAVHGSSSLVAEDDGDQNQVTMIVDSGTTLTFIPQALYEAVESYVANKTIGKRVDDPLGMFDLCYDTSEEIKPPGLVINFSGADVALSEDGIFVELEEGVACFTLVGSEDDFYIFGNLNQMNYHVGYDLKKMELSFAPTDCSKGQ